MSEPIGEVNNIVNDHPDAETALTTQQPNNLVASMGAAQYEAMVKKLNTDCCFAFLLTLSVAAFTDTNGEYEVFMCDRRAILSEMTTVCE